MRIVLLIIFALSFFSGKRAVSGENPVSKKRNDSLIIEPRDFCKNIVGLFNPGSGINENYIFDQSLYQFRVDTLAQVKFWREIMNMHHDSAIVNFAHNRELVSVIHINEWNSKSEDAKKCYRDSLRDSRCYDSTARVLITSGKRFFYDFDRTSKHFHQGINCFIDNGVDPWYAQAILLIESPNKLQKSNVGAYGPFQLMKGVAKMYGLTVNKHLDERADFNRSAYAASSLIKKICIPYAHKILDSVGIKNVNEDELWFRLLVMHVYHAGAYNVQKAILTMQPKEGNMNLIYTLWQTQSGRFKMSSQNYSQLVLAAMLEMDQRSGALQYLSVR